MPAEGEALEQRGRENVQAGYRGPISQIKVAHLSRSKFFFLLLNCFDSCV